jgi:MFS family permease
MQPPELRAQLPAVASLLLSVAILLTGHGLQLSLLPLRAEWLGFDTTEIGLTGSFYFVGFVVGCLTVPAVIARVGHIRTFAVLAAIATASLLLVALSETLLLWILLRGITGWALCGLYMVIESWLNERTPNHIRGGVLSLYTMLTLLAVSSAQLFLGMSPPGATTLFIVGALLLCLAIVPVGLTTSPAPTPPSAFRFRPRQLFETSQVAVVAALLGGTVTGSFWTLGPVYASAIGFSPGDVGLFMIAAILGGAALQFPIGRLSDRLDRRRVILVLALAGAIASVLLGLHGEGDAALVLAFFFGATVMPLYALCMAHANDIVTEDRFVETASGILMMNSLGSVLGPTIAAPLMAWLGPGAIFHFAGTSLFLASAWTGYRLYAHVAVRDHVQPFVAMPEFTPPPLDLDPRGSAHSPSNRS